MSFDFSQVMKSPYTQAALLGTGTLAGTRPNKAVTAGTIAPEYGSLADLLRRRATDRLNATLDTTGLTANGVSDINEVFKGLTANSNNNLTSRGLASSPVAGIVGQNLNIARGGQIADFLNQLPLLQAQYQDQGLGIAGNILNSAPRTTTQTEGGGLSGGIQSAQEMLSYLNGKGVLGAGASGGATSAGLPAIAPTIGAVAPSAASLAPIATPSLEAIAGGAVPEIPLGATFGGSVAAGGGTLAGATSAGAVLPGSAGFVGPIAPAAGTGAAGGGVGAAITGFLTNPITIGVGAAIAAALIWKHSQVHPTASTFVNQYQNPFGQHLGEIVNQFDKAYATGQLTKAQALQIRAQVANLTQQFDTDLNNFAAKGGKEKTVAGQARATMNQYFGANWSGVLGKMDGEIARLG